MKNPLFVIFLFVCLSTKAQEKRISYEDLVQRLTDLKALAQLPEPGEKSAMWSSYDRQSEVDAATGEFLNWEANDDGLTPQYIRKEGNREVLAEMEGPGAIVRIWSASPAQGHVKIYIDGQEQPLLDLPFIDYFKPAIPAFDYPELVYETNARGFNNYVPITYQKSCKIVADEGWGQYYHFNYITFPQGTEVEKFDPAARGEKGEALKEVNSFFASQLGESPYDTETGISTLRESLAAGESKTISTIPGEGAIKSLKARVEVKDSTRLAEILRKVVLQIRWDGEEEPAVWSPLGDFFGTSPGWNEYRTLPMGMTGEWMYSYWYMPFEDGAEVTLQNDYNDEVTVVLEIGQEKLSGEADGLTRFHAKWHRDLEPVQEERWPDWKLLETTGAGRFVGTHLLVWNPKGGSCSLAGPGHHWWGEGDEKFFIDGEEFPSTFGTGTEDYFGYAWCDPSEFEHAFHSQTLDNDNMGYQPMNRWHIIDNIPFQESFDGYMEKYFPNHWPTQYSVVVYWYLDPTGEDPIGPTPVEERFGYEIPYSVFREEGVIEGEEMEIKNSSGGWVSPDVWAHESLYDEVSGHKVMIWQAPGQQGDQLQLGFIWPEAGRYKVEVNKVLSRDGGKFRFYLNDELGEVLDFDSGEEEHTSANQDLGVVELEPGPQQFRLEWIGGEGEGGAMRLDYLKLEKLD